MTRRQRINNIIIGLLMIAVGIVLCTDRENGYVIVVAILAVALMIKGFQMLVYYFTMARHMVGGKMTLYRGIILTDLGVFAVMFAEIPKAVVMLFLIGIMLFSGVISIMRALEQKKLNYPHWRHKIFLGCINIIAAISYLFFLNSGVMLTEIYVTAIIASGIGRLYNAFRRTSVRVEKL